MTAGPAYTRDDTLDDARTLWRHALGILAASTVLRLLLGTIVPLFPDETYYWEWSRHLAGGYFDHPPMIAVLIAGGRILLGDTPLGVRLLPIIAGSVAGLALTTAAWDLAGARAARFAALTFSLFPMAAAGFILATPDAPLLAAVSCTLLAVVRALGAPAGSPASTRCWIGGGIAIGLAMSSKFTGVFIPAALLLAFVVHPPLRTRLLEPGPWIAVGIASLVMLPVLLWNAEHDWIAFRFQLGHGLGVSLKDTWVTRELKLAGGQLALATPILFVLLVAASARALRAPREERRFPLAVIAAFCAVFFAYSATRRSVEANWPAIAWLPAIILLAAAREGLRVAWERRALWLAGSLSAILLTHVVVPILPLPPRRDQVSQAHGWDGLAGAVDSARHAIAAASASGAAPFIAANRYQDAAMLAFHLPDHADVAALNLGGRRNQYDLWPRFAERARPGADLLLVLELPREGLPGPIRRLDGHFASITAGPFIPLLRGATEVGRRRLWVLTGWSGTWPADSTDPRR